MPDTGSPWNIPYVEGTDLVADWPTDSLALANAIADGLDDVSPEWTNFTPSWNAGVTVGNGTYSTSSIAVIGDVGVLQLEFILGSTSAITGVIQLDNPFPRNLTGSNDQTCLYFDGSSFYVGSTRLTAANVIGFEAINTSGTYATTTATSSTVPFTWGTSDRIRILATYRLASA